MSNMFGGLVQHHMPFTAGTYFGRQLTKVLGRPVKAGNMHDLSALENPRREVMTTRVVWDWYRSAFGYMSPKWRCAGTDSVMWNVISARLTHCREDNFDDFMHNIFLRYPGLFSWAFRMYAAPGVEVIHVDDIDAWLWENYNLRADPEPFNTHADPNLVVSPVIRMGILETEDPVVLRLTRTNWRNVYEHGIHE